ncbi:MAG TPA: malate dehydrogenase [Gemmatimonadota bacterium]|nr:malate dehydrogenase [Gemmatimonadota bacterium]
MSAKITVVGAGHVGATTAQRLAELGIANEVVLIDILEGVPKGKALDLWEAAPVLGYDTRLSGGTDYGLTDGSDIVIVTAGLARKPGMSRDDLLKKNAEIVQGVAREIASRCPEAIVLVVSNPLDVMSYVTLKTTGFDRKRVIGMAGVLDTARFRSFIALELDVSVRDVSAFVLGGHGDSMVPLPRYSTVAGIPLPHLLSEDRIEALVDRTRKGGGEIVELLGSGSAYYAPSAAVVEMAEAILRDRNRILPCAAWLQGEYGLSDVYVGVPVKLGAGGIKEIVEIELTGEEKKALHASAADVKETMSKLDL